MISSVDAAARLEVDGFALKPTEVPLDSVELPSIETLVVDWEGPAAFPDIDVLERLANGRRLRVTTPVRADGFDPLGDDRWDDRLPDDIGRVLVPGNGAYLTPGERRRGIAKRLGAALDRHPDAWIGSEGCERIATATGATQFELLGPDTDRAVAALRATGFEADVNVYAPTVATRDEDAVLDALGPYAARRPAVRERLPAEAPVGAEATGRTRERLLEGIRQYALVGDPGAINERIRSLRAAGVTRVIAYPATGLDGQ